MVRSMDGDSPELVVEGQDGPTTWERTVPGQRAWGALEGGPGGLAPHRLVPTLTGLQVQVVHGP